MYNGAYKFRTTCITMYRNTTTNTAAQPKPLMKVFIHLKKNEGIQSWLEVDEVCFVQHHWRVEGGPIILRQYVHMPYTKCCLVQWRMSCTYAANFIILLHILHVVAETCIRKNCYCSTWEFLSLTLMRQRWMKLLGVKQYTFFGRVASLYLEDWFFVIR